MAKTGDAGVNFKEPSNLDIRVAKRFQDLAREGSFFPVECRFRLVIRTNRTESVEGKKEPYTHIAHKSWLKGAEEFRKHFGNAANYFAGALEYVHRATGWQYPCNGLIVMIMDEKKPTSGGFALPPPGLQGVKNRSGEIRIFWADGEFTLTVLHELVHLFKPKIGGGEAWEDWVEQQALELTLGI